MSAQTNKGSGSRGRGASPRSARHIRPDQLTLYRAQDNGPGVPLDPSLFGGSEQEGWGRAFESFRRLNEAGLKALNLSLQFDSSIHGPVLKLYPGDRAGAIPLRSGASGHVVGGFVVSPRFEWSGIGSVLAHTGWHAAPTILALPLVPGSGREVPPWVLAGPVIARLKALLSNLVHGFSFREETREAPRGTIQWPQYVRRSLASGRWHQVPSRFPDLDADPLVRGMVRWTLERVLRDLVAVSAADRVAADLILQASRLLDAVGNASPIYPRPEALGGRVAHYHALLGEVFQSGVQAIGWVRDERGLGGGRQMDGLAWALPLNILWEELVAVHVQEHARMEGGTVRLGRRGQTLVPLRWSSRTLQSMGSLVPDIVVNRQGSVWVVDAKYKSHLADIDDTGWRQMADDIRSSHRTDLHQVLAYSALFDAPQVTATLAYPLRPSTWRSLHARGLDRPRADIYDGARHVRIELWGLPFAGGSHLTNRTGWEE